MAIINGTGGDDILNGGAEDDVIDGLAGADTMVGGAGNDDYHVDNVQDSVVEAAGEGVDRVFSEVNFTLGANVEILKLLSGTAAVTGTGNALDNEIYGNQNNNVLSSLDGDDKIDGGDGGSSGEGQRRVAVQRRAAACRVVVELELGKLPLQIAGISEQ